MEKLPRTQYCQTVGLVLSGVNDFGTKTCSEWRGKVVGEAESGLLLAVDHIAGQA